MKSMISPLTLLLVFAAPAALAAEDVYRSTMPDGRVMYGESPYPGAKSVRKLPPSPASTGMTYATPEEKMRAPLQPVYEPKGGVGILRPPVQEQTRVDQGGLQAPQGLPKPAY